MAAFVMRPGNAVRTEVVIFEAVFSVAGGVGVPVGDGLDPFGEGAGGFDVGGSGGA